MTNMKSARWNPNLTYFLLLVVGMIGLVVAEVPNATIWLEAEDAVSTNFKTPGMVPSVSATGSGVSAGFYLGCNVEDTKDSGETPPYFAEWKAQVATPGTYFLWIAASPQDEGWVSPLWVRVNGGDWVSLEGRKASATRYGVGQENYFGWVKVGEFELKSGPLNLRAEIRSARKMDNRRTVFLDALFLTTDATYIPTGNHPIYSPQPTWAELLKNTTFDEYRLKLESLVYHKKIKLETNENPTGLDSDAIISAISKRPVAIVDPYLKNDHEFGLHGMEEPFVVKGKNVEKTRRAFDLLARAGVQNYRTAGSCWHRVGDHFDQFSELDFHNDLVRQSGASQLFNVGYPPPPQFTVSSGLSAVRPEFEEKYREYLRVVIKRYQAKGLKYLELGNEVDAENPWWRGGTAEMYVNEMRMLKEEASKIDPKLRTVAFGSTYARSETLGGPNEGRRFVRKCFELGIDKYVDAYSLHYTWPLEQQDFVAFFRKELKKAGSSHKPLLNTEEAGYGHPSDLIKVFARDFYLHDMKLVTYYLAQDWFEAGNLIHSGLFDLEWNPKPRLLAYAAACDAMKYRHLLGMATPAPQVEAYILERNQDSPGAAPRYSIVIWKNDPAVKELISSERQELPQGFTSLSLWEGAEESLAWDLQRRSVKGDKTIQISSIPITILASELPKWDLVEPKIWLEKQILSGEKSKAIVPADIK
jgi:hypothetical protein